MDHTIISVFEKEFETMRETPHFASIILHCLQIGAGTGTVFGTILGVLCAFAASPEIVIMSGPIGFCAGLVVGLVLGLANGLALALLLKKLSPPSISARSLRLAFGMTCIVVSIFVPLLVCPKWVLFLGNAGWWAVAIAGVLATIAWFASGRFYFWYVSNVPVPLGEAPYSAEINL